MAAAGLPRKNKKPKLGHRNYYFSLRLVRTSMPHAQLRILDCATFRNMLHFIFGMGGGPEGDGMPHATGRVSSGVGPAHAILGPAAT